MTVYFKSDRHPVQCIDFVTETRAWHDRWSHRTLRTTPRRRRRFTLEMSVSKISGTRRTSQPMPQFV